MLKNATYNLMETASVLSKGLHRYDQFQADAKGCAQCEQIWDEMKRKDERELERIVTHLRQHLDKEPNAKAA